MQPHHTLINITRGLIAATALLTSVTWQSALGHAAPSSSISMPKAVIASVMPNPASGAEWVELRVDETLIRRAFIPIVSTTSASGPTSQVGEPPFPAGAFNLKINGWELSNDAGVSYIIPAALPSLPVGTRIRIYFDGLGDAANDYDLSDGLAVLHSPAGTTNVLTDSAGQVSLYSGSAHTDATMKARSVWP